MIKSDVTIIGGGLVGLATAYRIQEVLPRLKVIVLEKETEICRHQSGNNSGVIHSGIYYKPGTLKATNCRQGKADLLTFCQENGVPFKILGKVIVAVEKSELPTLEELLRRGKANGVQCSMVDTDFLKQCEPHVSGIQGIYVPEAGIVDYPAMAKSLKSKIEHHSGNVITSSEILAAHKESDGFTLETTKQDVRTKFVVNCAGLYSDHIAKLLGSKPQIKIIPFRGEYYDLKPAYEHLCKTLIYPVPNMNFPFLGVHFTRRIGGGVECGPNAVLALAREGYNWRTISPLETFESLTYPGFIKLAGKYWKEGWDEIKRSFSKKLFTQALQRLIPEIQENHLAPGGAGIRAQAIGPDGKLVDDFVIDEAQRVINVLNAPSPGATSCLNIGKTIALMLKDKI